MPIACCSGFAAQLHHALDRGRRRFHLSLTFRLRQWADARPRGPAHRVFASRALFVSYRQDGTVTRLIDRHGGRGWNSPNDVVVKSDGTIWFTDPLYGIHTDYEGRTATLGAATGAVSLRSPKGTSTPAPAVSTVRTVWPFRQMRSVFMSPRRETRSRTFRAVYSRIRCRPDGRLSGGDVFHTIEPGYSDGTASMRTAIYGRVRRTECIALIPYGDFSARYSSPIVFPTSHSAARPKPSVHWRFAHALRDVS